MAIKKLDTEIMQIHDEVMPKMGKVLSSRKQIQSIIDSTRDVQKLDKLQSISYKLTRADKGMMEWMRNYRLPDAEPDSILKYLEAQKAEVEMVKADINSGLELAERAINEK